jgi:hypothetical protein
MMIRTISFLIFLFLSGCATFFEPPTPQLHVIGVYEGHDPDDDGRPWWSKCDGKSSLDCHAEMTGKKRAKGGFVTVNVSITDAPIVLALSAYSKVKWDVQAKPGVQIQKVILSGYHAQSIEGIADTTILEVYTYDASPCDRCYQGNGYFYSYKRPHLKLTEITGLDVTSFQGKYKGREFAVFPRIKHHKTL